MSVTVPITGFVMHVYILVLSRLFALLFLLLITALSAGLCGKSFKSGIGRARCAGSQLMGGGFFRFPRGSGPRHALLYVLIPESHLYLFNSAARFYCPFHIILNTGTRSFLIYQKLLKIVGVHYSLSIFDPFLTIGRHNSRIVQESLLKKASGCLQFFKRLLCKSGKCVDQQKEVNCTCTL